MQHRPAGPAPMLRRLLLVAVLTLGLASVAAPAHAAKPYRQGLVATVDATGTNSVVNHVIIHSNWRDLESADQAWVSTGWNRIANMLSNNPSLRFSLRVFTGGEAPTFVKNLGGGCINVTNPTANITECVPRFWLSPYQAEWKELMVEVARRFGANARFLDVINNACTTVFAENFIIGNDPASVDRLANAGLNETTHRDCLNRAMADQQNALSPSGTRTSTATHNTWQIVVKDAGGGGHIELSWPKERTVLNNWHNTYGDMLIVQNNGKSANEFCAPGQALSTATSLYCWMATRSHKPPTPNNAIGFQLGGVDTIAEAADATQEAADMGACFVESAVGRLNNLPNRNAVDAQLEATCP
jgi:hypothetical protein